MKILCIGEEWRGSNSSGLFYAFSRLGHVTQIVNEREFISASAKNITIKSLNRLIRPMQIKDFNDNLLKTYDSFKPKCVLVYKGAFLYPETIRYFKKNSIVVNFFPDVSFFDHGSYIGRCITLYDWVFSTKSFAKHDLVKHFNYHNVTYLPHGFDPWVHLNNNRLFEDVFACEASFIGNFSKKKESYLENILSRNKNLDLMIWGNNWRRQMNEKGGLIERCVKDISVTGDAYVAAIKMSKVNIALLSENGRNSSSGDEITSRTFHIPAAGGFMLHERTDEFLEYFEEDVEACCFSSAEELSDKISFYIKNDLLRNKIAKKGHEMVVREHTLDRRAMVLLETLKGLF